MDKIIEKTRVLRENLNEIPLFQEYQNIKSLIENNDEIKELKRDIVRSKNENRLDDHKALLDRYNNHPLILNYENLKSEVISYLNEVADILNN